MISLIYLMGVLNSESHGLCVCEVKFSLIKAIDTTMGRFSNLFNGGTKKYKITKIYSESDYNLDRINSIVKLNKDTVFTDPYVMIRKAFEYQK